MAWHAQTTSENVILFISVSLLSIYGITLWGTTYHTYLSKLVIMQRRIITEAKYDAHTEPLFKTPKLLKLGDIYRLQVSRNTYSITYITQFIRQTIYNIK